MKKGIGLDAAQGRAYSSCSQIAALRHQTLRENEGIRRAAVLVHDRMLEQREQIRKQILDEDDQIRPMKREKLEELRDAYELALFKQIRAAKILAILDGIREGVTPLS